MKYYLRFNFLLILFIFLFAPLSVSAQFGGDLGAVTGKITWNNTDIPSNNMNVTFVSQTNGFTLSFGVQPSGYNTGFALPADIYNVTASIYPNAGPGFEIGTQVVTVTAGQTLSNINFDASLVSALVKGDLKVNGILTSGKLQFCSDNPSDPCPNVFNVTDGPIYQFTSAGFTVPVLPGNYRAHVVTNSNVSAGIVTITVVAGQILDDSSLEYSLNLGSVSGTVFWDTTSFPTNNTKITFQGQTTGFVLGTGVPSGNYNTGPNLPPDTYLATAFTYPNIGPGFEIGSQTVTVQEGQTVNNINFDASLSSGLIRGNLRINNQLKAGLIQFCSPNETDPCPNVFNVNNGPIYQFTSAGFIFPLQPGNYRMHVITTNDVHVDTIPITVSAGQIINHEFQINLGSIAGTVAWANLNIPSNNIKVDFVGQNTGFIMGTGVPGGNYSTGFSLPADTYNLTASIAPNQGPEFNIGEKTVAIAVGQSISNVNFDASLVTGLVRGNLKINGILTQGKLQFCSPNPAAPCPNVFNVNDGPIYQFPSNGFSIPLLPGDYRIHVVTMQDVDMGLLPITVVAGEILDLDFHVGNSQLTALGPVNVWVGLKNSDDVGIKFDLQAEIYKDNDVIATGTLESVSGGGSGFNNANLYSIPFTLVSPIDFPLGSLLQTKLYVRNACLGSNKNSGRARLWFNDVAADSNFGATIVGTATPYYFLGTSGGQNTVIWNNPPVSLSLDQGNTGTGPKNAVDLQAGAKCSPYKLWGTWTVAPNF